MTAATHDAHTAGYWSGRADERTQTRTMLTAHRPSTEETGAIRCVLGCCDDGRDFVGHLLRLVGEVRS